MLTVTTAWQKTMLDWMRQIQAGATTLPKMHDEVVDAAVRVVFEASVYVGNRIDLVPALVTNDQGHAVFVWEVEARSVTVTVRPGDRPVVIEREEGNLVYPSFGRPDVLEALHWLEQASPVA